MSRQTGRAGQAQHGQTQLVAKAPDGSKDEGPAAASMLSDRSERRNPLEKAFRILAWVADREVSGWGVREVARELEMAPSTAYRTLAALEKADIVKLDEVSGQYGFTLEFLRLASRLAADVPTRRAALPRLTELVELTGETAYLGLYDHRRMKMMYIDVVESSHPVQYSMARFEWLDLYAGAGGLGILPFLPSRDIEVVLASTQLRPLTPDTVTDPEKLRTMLREIRQRGYVISVGQRIIGAVGIAAPIYGPDNCVIGDLVLALPASRFSQRSAHRLGRHVTNAAAAVSTDLGASVVGKTGRTG